MNQFLKSFFALKSLWKYWIFLFPFILASFVVALSEILGITTLIPLLDGIGGGLASLSDFPIGDWIVKSFKQMPVDKRMQVVAVIIALVGLLRGGAIFVTTHLCSLLDLKIYMEARSNAFKRLFFINMQRFYDYEGGKLFSVVESLSERMSSTASAYMQMIGSFVLLAFHISLLMLISWELTIISSVVLISIHFLMKNILTKPLRTLSERSLALRIQFNSLTAEIISGMKFIHLTAREEQLIEKNNEISKNYIKTFKLQQKYYDTVIPAFGSAITLVIAALILGSALIFQGDSGSKIVSILLFLFIITRLSTPVQTIIQNQSIILKNTCAFEEYKKFFVERDLIQKKDESSIFSQLNHEICFENVNFRYKENAQNIFENISFSIPAQKITALVGPSGAGKTTIVNLLGKLFDPTSGRITIDGIDLKNIFSSSWLSKVGFVSQDVFLFNDSVENNLIFPCRNVVNKSQIEFAAKMAHAHEFIVNLKNGYQTQVGDKGVRLSGGQQQRLAIARAILMEPDIIVLDEATSHLDTLAELAIQEAIEYFRKKCTIVIIAHRLSTIKKAEQILVLEHGKLVQIGNHNALIAEPGLYREMTAAQSMEIS